MGMLVYADQPQQGEPALPVTRHIQVRWEWCPMTVPPEADPDGYGLWVVRNTNLKASTL